MKFWINRAAEVFCKSKEIPTPLLYGDFDGVNGYPWEEISLSMLCKKLYQIAAQSGYIGALDDFKKHFGENLEKINSLGLVTQSANGLMSAVDKAKLDGINIQCKTTAEWNSDPTFIPKLGEIIIYSDNGLFYNDLNQPIVVPNIKIGDGNAYCIDLPFVTDAIRNQIIISLNDHINDNVRHITAEERQFWNNKLNYTISGEELTLDRN